MVLLLNKGVTIFFNSSFLNKSPFLNCLGSIINKNWLCSSNLNTKHKSLSKGFIFRRLKSSESYSENESSVIKDDFPVQHYKDIKLHCKLLHAFDVVQQAFAMNEEEVEELFYDGRLRINKERNGKRFAKVYVGDIVDLILKVSEEDVLLRRVKLLHVNEERSTNGKWVLRVRRWKNLKLKRILNSNAKTLDT